MKDDFKPVYKQTIEHYTIRLSEIIEEERTLKQEKNKVLTFLTETKALRKLKRKEKDNVYAKLAKLNLKIKEVCEIKDKVRKELEERMNDIERTPFSDDVPQIYNECVGYCYGKCIYVDNDGDLRYREATEDDAEQIGETTERTDLLEYLYNLPSAEFTMIITYLKESPDTPLWVKEYTEDRV